MKAIFLSDSHLRSRESEGYQNLMTFLNGLWGRRNGNGGATPEAGDGNGKGESIKGVDDLYILGDFFDFWFCEGSIVYPEFVAVVELLRDLHERGIRIHLCEGNHDFFLADYFADELGFEVIKEWAAIDLDERRVLISHGDMVDERNKKYLLLRRFLRSNFFYKLKRVIPIAVLWEAARISSNLSRGLSQKRTDNLTDKMRRFSLIKFKDGYDAVILGHCHKHLIEEPRVNGEKKTFAILGDWLRHNSYLCYEEGSFSLATFQPPRE